MTKNNKFKMSLIPQEEFQERKKEWEDEAELKHFDVTQYFENMIKLIKDFPTDDYEAIASLHLTFSLHLLVEMVKDREVIKDVIKQATQTAKLLNEKNPTHFKDKLSEDNEDNKNCAEDCICHLRNASEEEKQSMKAEALKKFPDVEKLITEHSLFKDLIGLYHKHDYDPKEFLKLLVTFASKLMLEIIPREEEKDLFEECCGKAEVLHFLNENSIMEAFKNESCPNGQAQE